MNFATTVFPWTLLLRKEDGTLADAQCDDDGALRVAVVRSASQGVLVEPPRDALFAPARMLEASAGRTVRRLLVFNAGDNVRTLQLFDAAAMPAQGDAPVFVWPVANQFATEISLGRTFEAGIAWAASSTPGVYTPDAAAQFWVLVELEPQ